MSIFNAMNTSISGMNAQASRLATYSENIANSDTVGYKAANAQFETILNNQFAGGYTSAGVVSRIRYGIVQQGVLAQTASSTDLAIKGSGFFVVADANGAPHLTRAGSFVPDAAGYLVNTAGFRLMGLASPASASATTSTGFGGLSVIKIDTVGMVAAASTSGAFTANLQAPAVAVGVANLPSANSASATPGDKTSLIAYDNLGNKVTLDVYMTKTGDNQWEAAVFDAAGAGAAGFPYSAGPLATTSLQFDPANGKLAAPASGNLSIAIPGGKTLDLDISRMTQLGAAYQVSQATVDGSAPSQFSQIRVDQDGTVSALYQNGVASPQYQIQLATVPSVDNLAPVTGDIFDVTRESGGVVVGKAGSASLGAIMSSTLENSTVDIATELTGMIETQRSYTANSKAFQIATDATDVLVNLKV